ncbi:MAG: hypothetical protein LBN08_05635 [Lactobacillales bacterium]|jgi:hypothetical protein|nr:hypothetical protein [Lactobacillales bacterium]
MELNSNEALSHRSGLAIHCPSITATEVHVTKFGVGSAHGRAGVVMHKCQEPMALCAKNILGTNVMRLEYCFAQVCDDADIKAIYIELVKNGYTKEQITSRVPKRKLRWLKKAPEEVESVAELDFYFLLDHLGIELPECNHTFAMNKMQYEQTGRKSIRPDFYWAKYKIVVEYQGYKDHFYNKEDILKDHSKLNVYAGMGIRCFQVNYDIMRDPVKLKAFIKNLKSVLAL